VKVKGDIIAYKHQQIEYIIMIFFQVELI